MKKMTVLFIGLAMTLSSGVAQANGSTCTATCLLSSPGQEDSGIKILVSASHNTKFQTLFKLVKECQSRLAETLTAGKAAGSNEFLTAQLFTEISVSKGNSSDGTGGYVKYSFDVNAACVD